MDLCPTCANLAITESGGAILFRHSRAFYAALAVAFACESVVTGNAGDKRIDAICRAYNARKLTGRQAAAQLRRLIFTAP